MAWGARRRLTGRRRPQVAREATRRPESARRPKKRPRTRAAVAGGRRPGPREAGAWWVGRGRGIARSLKAAQKGKELAGVRCMYLLNSKGGDSSGPLKLEVPTGRFSWVKMSGRFLSSRNVAAVLFYFSLLGFTRPYLFYNMFLPIEK